jgi:hypothetical protein
MPPSSPLGALFRQLDDLKIKVGALKRAPVRGDLRAEALKTHAAELKETWECLCEETGLAKDEKLCATDVLAASPSRYLPAAWWHATPCTHRPVFGTKPRWGWPTRKRSTPGKTMAVITLGGRRYFLHTYRRSTSMPKTIKWAGTTEPKWVAGKDEEPGQSIVLEHKLSVPEKEPDLIPYTPHKMHLQDLLVRFSGTQEVMVREVGDQHDRITFSGMTQPEYSFLDVKYLTQFHQDLRGRKAVACVDVDNVSTSASVAHSPKLYLWRDAQSSDIHFHTLSYDSQAEGKELEFPLLWLHGTSTKQKPSSRSLLFHFRLDAERDGEKKANKRHSGLRSSGTYTHSNSAEYAHAWSGNVSETKDVGYFYVPPKYKALLARHKSLAVNFESVSGKPEFQFLLTLLMYDDNFRLRFVQGDF